MSERYCTNCRAELSDRDSTCPTCGTYAGDVFDGKLPGRKRKTGLLLTLFAFAAVSAAGAWWWNQQREQARAKPDARPVNVVKQRPGGEAKAAGAVITETGAIITLRNSLSSQVKSECLAMTSQGYQNGGYVMTVVDSCAGTRMGRFRVDGKTGEVSRAR